MTQPPLARTCFAFALALIFAAAGASKLIDHQTAVDDFTRWGLPAPAALSIAVGVWEVCAAALLMAGVAARRVALAFAGRADGGPQLVVSSALAVLCLALAWLSPPGERVPAQ